MTPHTGNKQPGPVSWLLCAVLLALSGCMGGTGTDTENGVYISARVVDASDNPVANVEVSVLDLSARVDSLSPTPLANDEDILTTDQFGRVSFLLKKNGTFMAAGKHGDSTLFIDTLRTTVPPQTDSAVYGALGSPRFRVERPLRAVGAVQLASGYQIDTGRVLLRGTRIISELQASGIYDLGWLPPSAQQMVVTLVYSARPTQVRFVKVSEQNNNVTVYASLLSGRCLTDSTQAVTTALTIPGSLSDKATIARIVGTACAPHIGALVTVLKVNETGAVTASLGNLLIPTSEAPAFWDADSSAVPENCLLEEKDLTGRATLKLSSMKIVVDDFKSGKGCLQ